jgi:ribosomal protein S18 acetylase RimI-like enzyme
MDTDIPVAADVRRRIREAVLCRNPDPPPHVGGYKQLALAKTATMLGAMKIRKARLTDAAVIADFNTRLAWESEKLKLDAKTILRGVRAALKDSTKGTYSVAEHDGAVIGQLLITYEWSDWRNGNFWWIQSVYVAAEHRKSGVFRALFTHVQNLATSRRDVCGLRLYVEKNNDRAQHTYAKLGMTKTHYEVFETDLRQKSKLAHPGTRAKLRA